MGAAGIPAAIGGKNIRVKGLVSSQLRKNLKKPEKKFWKSGNLPIFASRYGGNGDKEKGERSERGLKQGM